EELAVALRAAVLLAALHLDDEDLVAAALADDFTLHAGAREERLAESDFRIFARLRGHQNAVELDRRSNFALELLKAEDVPGLHTMLFPTRFKNCVHRRVKMPLPASIVKGLGRTKGGRLRMLTA